MLQENESVKEKISSFSAPAPQLPENSQIPPKSCFSLSQGTPEEEIPPEILTGIRKSKAAPMEEGPGRERRRMEG